MNGDTFVVAFQTLKVAPDSIQRYIGIREPLVGPQQRIDYQRSVSLHRDIDTAGSVNRVCRIVIYLPELITDHHVLKFAAQFVANTAPELDEHVDAYTIDIGVSVPVFEYITRFGQCLVGCRVSIFDAGDGVVAEKVAADFQHVVQCDFCRVNLVRVHHRFQRF